MASPINSNIFETVLGFVVLVVAILFIFYATRFVSDGSNGTKYELHSHFERADGLKVGAVVSIAGVQVGELSEIKLDPKLFNAHATIKIDEDIQIPRDSSLEIVSEGLLGGKYLNITPGGDIDNLKHGENFTFSQSAISLEGLIQKFIFNQDVE